MAHDEEVLENSEGPKTESRGEGRLDREEVRKRVQGLMREGKREEARDELREAFMEMQQERGGGGGRPGGPPWMQRGGRGFRGPGWQGGPPPGMRRGDHQGERPRRPDASIDDDKVETASEVRHGRRRPENMERNPDNRGPQDDRGPRADRGPRDDRPEMSERTGSRGFSPRGHAGGPDGHFGGPRIAQREGRSGGPRMSGPRMGGRPPEGRRGREGGRDRGPEQSGRMDRGGRRGLSGDSTEQAINRLAEEVRNLSKAIDRLAEVESDD